MWLLTHASPSAYSFTLDAALLLSLAEADDQRDFLLSLLREKAQERRGISYTMQEVHAATAIARALGGKREVGRRTRNLLAQLGYGSVRRPICVVRHGKHN